MIVSGLFPSLNQQDYPKKKRWLPTLSWSRSWRQNMESICRVPLNALYFLPGALLYVCNVDLKLEPAGG